MYPYNRGCVPPHSNGDPNQTNAPNQPVALVPTRSTVYGAGFVEYNKNQTGFMNLLNQTHSWDPNCHTPIFQTSPGGPGWKVRDQIDKHVHR
ncbi:hypothetical protein Hanom_Chr14g01281711 [Helianthus anomalus]